MKNKTENQLKNSLSPYLRQHAKNPVDWYEWNNLAFEKAERENKLLLVSIGYSACHWCHVMAHESFEDIETAEIMNQYFVCVKVDREELPNVDQLYMDACQLVNGNGGWPLNAFALPDKRPIHALTYAPKSEWHKILHAIHDLWEQSPNKAYEYAEKLAHGIKTISLPPGITRRTKDVKPLSHEVFNMFKENFDNVYGGQNRAPKFPMPTNWLFLLKYALVYSNIDAQKMAVYTLEQMAMGGIYDAIEGGFSRYSVDKRWFAPHFEKMLYDNAQLIEVYSYAYHKTKHEFFKRIALETIQFCKQEWKTKYGVYQSALDADSEGVEGKYYTLTYNELEKVLGSDLDIFAKYYQCTQHGNWEESRNILFPLGTIENAAIELKIDSDDLHNVVKKSREILKVYRKTLIKPGIDDKCINSWNNLFLKGISESAVYLNDSSLFEEAEALEKSISNSFIKDGEMYRIFKDGELKIDAFLEDYSTYLDALLSLFTASLDENYLLKAERYLKICIDKFYDSKVGFFKFESSDGLLHSKFDINDDVINSGNSIMANVLWKMSWYFSRNDWREMAEKMLESMHDLLKVNLVLRHSNWANLSLQIETGAIQKIISSNKARKEVLSILQIQIEKDVILGYVSESTQVPLFKGKGFNGTHLDLYL
ncbi:MAG: thioredoxin domain-containing protein [Bacteroidia bacterium]